MLERHVYVLKVWRDVRGDIHATLKSSVENQPQHFPDLMAAMEFIKAQFSHNETLESEGGTKKENQP